MTTFAKLPQFYGMGNQSWTTSDGTTYMGVLNNFNIREVKEEAKAYGELPTTIESKEEAVGHLKEALDAGFELLYLNLRPGWHHVRMKQE